MKLVYNFYSSFKGSKYKMAAQFGQKNHFFYQINWCAILISSLNLPKQGIFDSETVHNKLKPILHIFQTELLIVMNLQYIPLNICFRVMNLNKVLRK